MNIPSNPLAGAADLYAGLSPADAAQRQRIARAINSLNNVNMFGENREITFAVDRTTNRSVIRVIDRETRETVAQLPPEYVLRLAASIQKGK